MFHSCHFANGLVRVDGPRHAHSVPVERGKNTVFKAGWSRSTPLMSTPPRANAPSGRDHVFPLACLVAVAIISSLNSFAGAWVFDDLPAIRDNPSLRAPWSLAEILHPFVDGGTTVSGRPVVNLSFALSQIIGGGEIGAFHATNLLIHLLAGLLLYGVGRRTFHQPVLARRYGKVAAPLALAVASIWLAHPLQTESVTYIVQRAESLAGLWYLLVLYGFIRSTEMPAGGSDRPSLPGGEGERDDRKHPSTLFWQTLSFVACLLGMATKEVMVTAPLVVLLYDLTFVSGTLAEAWRRRRGYYLALAATWLLLAGLLAGNAGRGGTAGFGAGVGAWTYLLTQCRAIVMYLKLVIWPAPLVFDYGTGTVGGLGEVWPQALFLVGLAGATLWALVKRPVWGFLGACFLALLAPSSSVVPVATQTMAEHRMYLALVVPVLVVVLGLWRLAGRWSQVVAGLLVLGCVGLTLRRNEDYRSPERLWTDTAAKNPASWRAHHELGLTLVTLKRNEEALPQFRKAIQLEPGKAEPHFSLGVALASLGRRDEAKAEYEAVLRLDPAQADARINLGNILLDEGRGVEAEVQFRAAIRSRPDYGPGHNNLANVLLRQDRPAEAMGPAREAVRLGPADGIAHYNLGNALAGTGQWPAAATEYEATLRLLPDFAEAHNNLGNVQRLLGRLPEARGQYEDALRLNPEFVEARRNLAQVLARAGRVGEAVAHYEILVQLRPGDAAIRGELDRLRDQAR